MASQCFVVMAIGDQKVGKKSFDAQELRDRYTHLIRESIQKARPGLEVIRADEVAMPGAITTDIFTRLMHAEYVVADISFPSPNVFYELGIRHACRSGTIVIRDKTAAPAPFDISGLRHFEYENTPKGLAGLADHFRSQFAFVDANPGMPDNEFLSLARTIKFKFPNYSPQDQDLDLFMSVMQLMSDPEISEMFAAHSDGRKMDNAAALRLFSKIGSDRKKSEALFKMMAASGGFQKPSR